MKIQMRMKMEMEKMVEMARKEKGKEMMEKKKNAKINKFIF